MQHQANIVAMLIPIYALGFACLALIVWAVTGMLPITDRTRSILRASGILIGPLYFVIVFAFSGWVRYRTYDMQWSIGQNSYYREMPSQDRVGEPLVVIYRKVGDGTCFEQYYSSELSAYLTSLTASSVPVRYAVIYDFFKPRVYDVESIGALHLRDQNRIYSRIDFQQVSGGRSGRDQFECFPW